MPDLVVDLDVVGFLALQVYRSLVLNQPLSLAFGVEAFDQGYGLDDGEIDFAAHFLSASKVMVSQKYHRKASAPDL